LAAFLVVAGLAATAGVVAREFERAAELRGAVDESYRLRASLKNVLSLHQDVETGQRGYIITGNESFLDPYESARGRLDRELAELDGRARRHTDLADTMPQLRRLSTDKLMISDRGVTARRLGRAADAAALVSSGRGKIIMDQIRATIAAMDRLEARRLADRVKSADATRRYTQRLAIILLVSLGLLFLGAAALAVRTIAARRRAMEKAQDAAARSRAILDSAKDGIITLNPSGSIEVVNEAAALMFDYRPDELERRDVGILFEIAPDIGAVETFLKRLSRGEVGAGRIEEFMARRKDGTLLPCEVAVSPMKLANGIFYVAVIRDITERRQVEQMKSEFVSTVSHELRTPLTSIAGSLGLISGGAAGALPERAARLVEIAHSNSKRLVRLINDILDIEKIESGKMPFEIVDLHLASFLQQAVAANQAYADEHKVGLELGAVPADAVVRADPDRLMQVMTNLISNAAKFSPAGAAVRIAVEPLDRRWRIGIADRGAGIPDEFRGRIFQKFAQADSSDTRAKGGTGLGLSIVREIMARLGGAIDFETRQGQGTTFFVDVPAMHSIQQRPKGGATESAAVLHVDDDPDVLRVVASALEANASIDAATSLASARRALTLNDYDLLILDIGLADGSGLDLLDETRLPTIVFSAQDADPALRSRVDAVLTKSRANLDQLVAEAERLLRKDS
jgi:PAS domain S-box-containing protein